MFASTVNKCRAERELNMNINMRMDEENLAHVNVRDLAELPAVGLKRELYTIELHVNQCKLHVLVQWYNFICMAANVLFHESSVMPDERLDDQLVEDRLCEREQRLVRKRERRMVHLIGPHEEGAMASDRRQCGHVERR